MSETEEKAVMAEDDDRKVPVADYQTAELLERALRRLQQHVNGLPAQDGSVDQRRQRIGDQVMVDLLLSVPAGDSKDDRLLRLMLLRLAFQVATWSSPGLGAAQQVSIVMPLRVDHYLASVGALDLDDSTDTRTDTAEDRNR